MKNLNYWERLEKLGIQSLQRRRERYIILYVWKILNKTISNDLNFNFRVSARRGITAIIPPLVNYSSKVQS